MITFTAAPDSVNLRNPTLNSQRTIDTKIQVYQTMNGWYRTHKATPVIYKHTLILESLRWSDIAGSPIIHGVETFRQFIIDHHGQVWHFIDLEGQEWIGWVITDPIEIIENNKDSFSCTLEYRGYMI